MTENRSPLSTAELERRWSAVRAAMQAEELDALVMQNRSDWVGGYVRWFTDIPATNGYPRTLIFPAEGPMAVIGMGAFSEVADLRGTDPVQRGIGRMISTPSFMSIDYTTGYDAELAVAELTRLGARRIGLIVPGGLPADLWRAVTALPGVETVNATDLVDRIKAIKSPEEIGLIRATCALQDQVFAAVLEGIRPGLTDAEVSALAEAEARRLGSDQGIFLCSSARIGQAARFKPRQLQGRRIEAGDHYSLLIEVNGPGGLYAEIARTIVLGRAPERLKEHFATVLAAQDHTLSLMKPGADPVEIAAAHDDWLRAHGLPPETRLYAHGQGTDMVERPMLRRDETMRLAENMNLAVHPGYDDGTVFAVVCDNYLIGPDGPGACLHGTEKRIFETA